MNAQDVYSPSRSSLILGIILVGYIFLSPIYLFPSGLPQPADFILVCGIGIMLIAALQYKKWKINVTLSWGVGFLVYTAFVNIINFGFNKDPRFIFAMFFYAYNFLAFALVSQLFIKYTRQMQSWAYMAVIVVILGQFLIIALFGAEWGRQSGTFNNPNQLAYWSLLCCLMLVILKKKDGLSFLDFFAILAVGYIQAQALSKAGIIVYVMLLGGIMLTPLVKKNMRILLIMATVVGSLFLAAQPGVGFK